MSESTGLSDFTVVMEGGFIGDRSWFVYAELRYRPGIGEDRRTRLAAAAQTELALGIVRESQRGRRLGAKRVHVLVEGDREMAGIFRRLERGKKPGRVA